ncbi:hypothetical protein Daus18300_002886 [Diaporthe australafricana]|uniref:Uncharacterized protein n=1 Tax=Diaporthe australafricana TaxID=127596 RepID=A0ABR3XJV5_9PEZI
MTSISPRDGENSEASDRRATPRNVQVTSKTIAGLNGFSAEDARIIELLVSFFSPSHAITYDFLLRGGSPRKRWTPDGGIEETDATAAGLSPELTSILSDHARLSHALNDLSTIVLRKSAQDYILDEEAASRIRQDLPSDAQLYWKTQALIVAYRAIPWKYIEPRSVSSRNIFMLNIIVTSVDARGSNFDVASILPQLQYVSQSYEDCLESLSPATRADFVLSLLEASRFPAMAWRRFAIAQAAAAMQGIDHEQAERWYLSSCLGSAQSWLRRLDGEQEAAVEILASFTHQEQKIAHDRKASAATGHLTIQRALNRYQVDDLHQAEQILQMWRPLGPEASLMEQIVQFRKGITLGKVLRTVGRFSEAYEHLKKSYDLAEQSNDLSFDEDRRDLISEMADTLRELEKPQAAEEYLRKEFVRRQEKGQDPAASGKSLLEASLAEMLFAQGRTDEAERLCTETESRADNLMKMGKLRICIVLAKIRQTRSDHEGALRYWDEDMLQVARFLGATGRTTRTILLSRRANMRALGLDDSRDQSRLQAAEADALGTPGGMLYWIAGMRHWQEFLDSGTSWSRM